MRIIHVCYEAGFYYADVNLGGYISIAYIRASSNPFALRFKISREEWENQGGE